MKALNVPLTEDFPYLAGLLAGDGSVTTHGKSGSGSTNYVASFYTTSPILRDSFRSTAEREGFRTHTYSRRLQLPSKKPQWDVRFQSVAFFRKFWALKRLSFAPVMGSPFIRGFYEAEGSISWYKPKHRRISLFNNNHALLKQIVDWLLAQGFKISLYSRVKDHGFKPNCTLRWEVRIVGNPQADRFLYLIQPLIKRTPN